MEIFGVRICLLLTLCFAMGSTWTNQRIYFQRLPNNTLNVLILTTPPSIKATTPNLEERMNTPEDVEPSKPAIQIPRGLEKFAFEMLSAISDAIQNHNLNFVMSPFSIWSLMVLIAEGASGRTFSQLESVLHLPNNLAEFRTGFENLQQLLAVNTSALEVALNQILFSDINRPLVENYVNILQNDYRADHFLVNFLSPDSAADAINNHINFRTKGKITNIVTPDELTEIHLVLASTVFFKGQWKFSFDINQTREQPFYAENGELMANVSMMTQQRAFRFASIDALKATFIELPYGQDNRFSMLLIQPYSSLNTVFANLRKYDIAKIHAALSQHQNENEEDETSVVVTVPRFKIESDLDLRTVFEFLGATDVFNQGSANLTKMSDEELHVSHVFHKAIIEVDEVGTVAAAVTVAELNFRITPQEFLFNKPFGFLITDRTTNALLFGGQVRMPMT